MSDLFKKVITVTTQGRGLRGYSVIIELAESGMIRWKHSYTGAPWNDIIDIADLKGDKGDKGEKGTPAPNTIFQYSINGTDWTTVATGAQWYRQSGDNGTTWSEAIAIGTTSLALKADLTYVEYLTMEGDPA